MSVLWSLYLYAHWENEGSKERLGREIVKRAVRLAMKTGARAQEAAVGLLTVAVGTVKEAELGRMMEEEDVRTERLAEKLTKLLERHARPMTALSWLRRYAVELALALAEHHAATFLPVFQALHFHTQLHGLADSVSEIENYATFFGATGVTPHSVPMSRLVDIAIECFRLQHPPSPP